MIDRPMDVWGAPLDVEVLLFGCLRSCCQLMELAQQGSMSPLGAAAPTHRAIRRPATRERIQRAAPRWYPPGCRTGWKTAAVT